MNQDILPGIDARSPDPIERRFFEYHRDNPNVYVAFVKAARHFKRRGIPKCGAKLVWEWLRIDRYLETRGASTFKFPNEYTCLYARLVMRQESDLTQFFTLRKRPSMVEGAFLSD